MPFISWSRDLKNGVTRHFEIDLYYCVNSATDALHLQEFEELEQQLPGFHVHLVRADQEGLLQAADIHGITQKDIFICGPKAMCRVLLKQMHALQVADENIYFENFDFF